MSIQNQLKKKKRKAQFLKEATKIKATLIQNVKTH